MARTYTPTPDELAQAAADAAANEAALTDAGVHLAGGDDRTDELEAKAEEEERRTGRGEEATARELQKLRLELEQTQEFVRQLVEANQTPNAIGGAAAALQRRNVHDAMIRAMIARGGRVTILIHPDPNPNHNWPVPIGINGSVIYVKRGVPTEVPVEYVGVLENARIEQRMPLLDGNEDPMPGGVTVDQLSYPYTLLPGAVPEESLATSFRPIDQDLMRAANQPRREIRGEAR